MHYSRVHPYTLFSFFSRFWFLLILPVLEGLIVRPQNLLQAAGSLSIQFFFLLLLIFWSVFELSAIGYHAGEGDLYCKKGAVLREWAQVPFEQVVSLTIRRTVLSSLFRAAKLYLDTPAGSKKRADVALTLSSRRLLEVAGRIFDSGAFETVYRASAPRLLLMSASWSNPAAGLLVLAPLVHRVGTVLGEEISDRLYSTVDIGLQLAALGIPPAAAVLAYLLICGWAFLLLVQLFRYGNFEVELSCDFLLLRRGVITQSERIIRREKICAISIRQTLLMRLFNLCSSSVYTVGSFKEKGDKSMLIAAAGKKRTAALLRRITPLPVFAKRDLAPTRGAVFSYVQLPVYCLLGFLLVTLLPQLFGYFAEVFRVVLFFFVPLFVWWLCLRLFAFRRSGVSFQNGALVLCGYRRLTVQSISLPLLQVRRLAVSQNPFQRRKNRCTLVVTLYAEGRETFRVKHLPFEETLSFLEKILPGEKA